MTVTVQPPMFESLRLESPTSETHQSYWWLTSGHDLARMFEEAQYPEDTQRQFLLFFRDTICPILGGRFEADSVRSGLGWDSNNFEYSFELKSSSNVPTVRFSVDVSPLRPADDANPLSIKNSETVINALAKRTPGFDDTWYRSLRQWFTHAHRSTADQKHLAAQVGHQTSMVLGFDIYRRLPAPDAIPVMAKVYFPPCFTAAAEGITRWEAVRQGVLRLPNIDSRPNILHSLALIQEYLDTKPKEYENEPRYLATDFVTTEKARLKIYMHHPAESFDDVWDFYTLGGRIPGLDEDKEKFRELVSLISHSPDAIRAEADGDSDYDFKSDFLAAYRKDVVLYFSLSSDNSMPAPKIFFSPTKWVANDEMVIQGVDQWLQKYGWNKGGKSMKQRVQNAFTHRTLAEKKGIFTFLALGRKEGPAKGELSMQIYVTGELYTTPRI